ncbi:SMODS domain-containing nucleotidyltransferase [Streptomyces pseudovenezuelae]|uniref:Nucleotidyltransferase n=1 Tax=Streptomyces pseudovenezuelae TaxID=67350 RepID=A0ABZ1X3T1_9ACTN|nr:nucleotidyltransferase [Streptomyces pseudovenezuelae]
MAKTVAQAFSELISKLTPTSTQFAAASTHRQEIESCLNARLGIYRLFETGSLRHGTGVRNHSDSDFMVSLKGDRPSSDTALTRVKSALSARYPLTPVRVSRPAVVCKFGNGDVEVTPAYIRSTDGDFSYWIPAPGGDWIISSPDAHNKYVTEVNTKPVISGSAKYMARLLKGWKYFNDVPVSSFYLEMRAAEYISRQSTVVWVYDLCFIFEELQSQGLAAMNDPKKVSGRIIPCSSDYSKRISLSKVDSAAKRARRALEAYRNEKYADAFAALDLLFNGKFPSRW